MNIATVLLSACRRYALLAGVFASLAAFGAWAQEAQIKQAVESRFDVKIESIKKAPFLGLYELVTVGPDREVIYTDSKGAYLFNGTVFDLKNRRNLTQERLDQLAAIRFEDLPLELAIKQVRGNGKRSVAIFADPYCTFCRQLDQNMTRLQDVTIYTFLYPILRKDESAQMASRIWCSPDRAKAYLDFMLRNREPARVASCNAPVDKWIALGDKLGVRATPVSYVGSGVRVVGARFDELQRLLDNTAKSPGS